ncbi:MAG TPA: hypothetical protein VK216_03665, partial [Magnetospirillaceae bacterium]|nr:hypothetical protein [Magnetospirillaceae bacterium]
MPIRLGEESTDFERIPQAVSPPAAPIGSPLCLPIPPSSHDGRHSVGSGGDETLDTRALLEILNDGVAG